MAMTDSFRTELAPGYSISRLINGCWQLSPDHGGGPASVSETLRHFADLVEHGFTTFDCADIYTGVEETIGRFRRSLADPWQIQVHTKFAPDRDTLANLTDSDIDKAIDRSLVRLETEQLDLLQFHWWNYATPGLDRAMERLQHAQAGGKIRLLGLTNFDTEHVGRILDNGIQITSLQAQYSLLDRRPQRLMTELAQSRNVSLLPYGVLAGGFLSERYLGAAAPLQMNRSLQKYRLIIDEAGGWDAFQELLQALAVCANKHDCSISQIATRWVLDQPGVAAVILGTGSQSRAQENCRLQHLRLDADDLDCIGEQLARLTVPPGDMYELERDLTGRHAGIIKMNLHNTDSGASA